MRGTLLLLLAALASLTFPADAGPLKVLSAPNLLRVGTTENIFVECQDCSGGDMNVRIVVINHPTKSKELTHTTVTLNNANKFQAFGQISIPTADFSRDPTMKQYVYLQAQFPDRTLEKVVLVSFQSGYIFIQTDKTLYTPNSKVQYRIFGVTPGMEPVEGNGGNQADSTISLEIVTPDNIVLPIDSENVILKSGMYSGHYALGEIVSTGVWKLVAMFQSNPQQTFSAEFEVKEYVLPSFEVKLTPSSNFYYVDSKEFTVDIAATYLFGQEVEGTAFVVFGVIREGQKKSFPASLQRSQIHKGIGNATLRQNHITQTFPDILELEKSSLYVAVSVLTDSGSEMVEAELRGIQIVQSPYTIHFKRTPKYFKPGMTFDVWIEVLNPNESPAAGVPVVVNPGEVNGITEDNGMARLTINTVALQKTLEINAKTLDQRISNNRQTSASMTAFPYRTNSNHYIHISVDATEMKLGKNLKVNLNLNTKPNDNHDITFLILSRGQLVKFERKRTEGQVLIAAIFPVTKNMLPSFRIVAYYHPTDNEVVSDSVWVNVKVSCMGTLRLEPTRDVPSYEPRKTFGMRVTGDPGATVGLVAVDKGVYVLNNKLRLTQKKIWDIVEEHDTGCTPGGGKDSMAVFFDAGLLFETSTASGTPYRQELKCAVPNRKKRAATLMEVTTSLLSRYQEKIERECCLDGMKEIPVSYSCERRMDYIVDGQACKDAFLHCCTEMKKVRKERREENLQLARSEDDDNNYMDSADIVTRTNFPESWEWTKITLPACSPGTPNCETTSISKSVPLPDSITTWQFTGISLSRTHGICVGEPMSVIVKKDFFIDLRLPYSAVRDEQLEIKAILHNYSPDPVTVRVELIEEEHVCSAASRRGNYRQEVTIRKETSRSVPFVIIPMKDGERTIEVKAAVKGSSLSDGIRKKLLVVPKGVLIKTPTVISIDPTKIGVGGKQEQTINSGIARSDLVPNTPTSTQISVMGREQVSVLVENVISGSSMASLIRQPYGCGEQNMITMTLPVIAATYLDKTNQWETVGFQKRDEALQHIRTGYTNELAFRNKQDGSFSTFVNRGKSTWLTAYVVKVFSMSYPLVAVQKDVICNAVKFLILTAQRPDGEFKEVGGVVHGEMIGDVAGKDSAVSMTAFCLIAMQESKTICTESVNSLPGSIDKAVGYLERQLPTVTNPYAIAMSSYALSNENKLNRELLYKFVSPDLAHWTVPGGHVYTLEATAYALLALVKAKALEDARPVVRWFNKQQKVGGGYGSTQATITVYQAVSEYWAIAKEPEYDLNVDIMVQGRSKPVRFNFNRNNHYATRRENVKDINQNVTVVATGTGEATLTMVSLYYAEPKIKESDCKRFQLSVELIPEQMGEDNRVYRLRIEVLYKNSSHDASMSILDIGLLTGFTPNKEDLDALSTGPARVISKYEMNKFLSERGSLIIYLDKVSHREQEEISFRIHQEIKVGVMQPAAVSVYEYYDQTHCVKFYHPERKAGHLLRLCNGEDCPCAEGEHISSIILHHL
ncbi:complement C3a.1 isoform X2 [Parambassis ranga]|uniref:Complement C3a.1 isoform X2 n=1 Tax=Parambassis ranga TaxID=210632 RepID=A0A6P7HNB6_9TELE|nr:complement C3-like isoform X2 [Parambassis ranga]